MTTVHPNKTICLTSLHMRPAEYNTTPPRPVHAIDAPVAAGETPEYKKTPSGSGHTLGRCARGFECVVESMEDRVDNQDRVRERTQHSCSWYKSPLHALCCILAKCIPAILFFPAAGIDLKRSCSPECARGVLSCGQRRHRSYRRYCSFG
jgi:hypothetical protein